ncbi:MAG: LPXTG cell wall anchor domain-containing protein [Sporichthyaceae bacterium]
MTVGIRRVTLASAAGVGIVLLQAAGVASAAHAATEPVQGGTTQDVHRAGFGVAFGEAAPADGGETDLGDVVRMGERGGGEGEARGTGDLLAIGQALHKSGEFAGGDGALLGVGDGGHQQKDESGGDATVVGLLGNNPKSMAADGDDEKGEEKTESDETPTLLDFGRTEDRGPVQLGGDGRETSRGTLLGIGNGGNGGPKMRVDDSPAILDLGNGEGEHNKKDGSVLDLGNGADAGPKDPKPGRGGVVWLLNAFGPAVRDGKVLELFNGPPRPVEFYSAASDDDPLAGGLLKLGNGKSGSEDGKPEDGPAGDGHLLKVGNGGDGYDKKHGYGGDGGALDLLNGKPPKRAQLPASGGDGKLIGILDQETPKGPADSGGKGSAISALTGGGKSKVATAGTGDDDQFGYAPDSGQFGFAPDSGQFGYAPDSGQFGFGDDRDHSGHGPGSGVPGNGGDSGQFGYAPDSGQFGFAPDSGQFGYAPDSGQFGFGDDSGHSGHGPRRSQAVVFKAAGPGADDEAGRADLVRVLQGGKGAKKGENSGGDGNLARVLEGSSRPTPPNGTGGDGNLANILVNPPEAGVATAGKGSFRAASNDENVGDGGVKKNDSAQVDRERTPVEAAESTPQGGSGGEGGVANIGNGGDARGEAKANGGDGKVAGVSNGGDDMEKSQGNGGDGTVADVGNGGDSKGQQEGNGGAGDVASVSNGGSADRGENFGGDGGAVRAGEAGKAAKPDAKGARIARPHRSVDGASSPLVSAGKGGQAQSDGLGEAGAGSVVDAGNGADAGPGNGEGEGALARVATRGDDGRTGKAKHKKGPKHAADKQRGGFLNLGTGGDAKGDGRGDGGTGSVVRAGNGGKGEIDTANTGEGDARGGAHRKPTEGAAGGLVAAGQGGNAANEGDAGRGSVVSTGNAGDGRSQRGKHREDPPKEASKRGAGRPTDEQGALIALFNGAKDRKRHLIDLGNGGAPLVALANGGRGDGQQNAAGDAAGIALGNGGNGGNAGEPAAQKAESSEPKKGTYASGQLIEAFNGADASDARSRAKDEIPLISLANGGRGSNAGAENDKNRKMGRNQGLLDLGNGGDSGTGKAASPYGVLLSAFNGGEGGGVDGTGGSGDVVRAGDGGNGAAGAGQGGSGGRAALLSTSNGGDGGYGGGQLGEDGGDAAIIKLADGGKGGNGIDTGSGGIGGKGGLLNVVNGGDGGNGTKPGDGGAGGDSGFASVGNGGKGFGKVAQDGGDGGGVSLGDGGRPDAGEAVLENTPGWEFDGSGTAKRPEAKKAPKGGQETADSGETVLPKTGAGDAAGVAALGGFLLLGGALLRRRRVQD